MRALSAAAIASVTCVAISALEAAARGQCDHSLTTFATSELEGGGVVTDMVVFDDGSGPALIVGGYDLREASSGYCFNVVKWTPEGDFVPLGDPTDLSLVYDLAVCNGSLYAISTSNVWRWTGSDWLPWGDGLEGSPWELIAFDDGSGSGLSLFAVTNTYAPSYTGRLMKLENQTWRQVTRFNQRISCVEVFGSRLIVAGAFTTADGFPVNRIAAWDGQTWLNIGAGVRKFVSDLVVHEIGGAPALIAAGSFAATTAGANSDFAAWDGKAWTLLPPTNTPNQYSVGPMAVWDNGTGAALYVTVTTESPSSGDHHDTLYRLDPVTQRWQVVGATFQLPDSYISSMVTYHEGNSPFATLFVGGKFNSFGTADSYHLVRLQPDGSIEPMPSDPRYLSGTLHAMERFNDGKAGPAVYAGGKFRALGNPTTLVARFQGDSWVSIAHGGGTVRRLKTLDLGGGPALYAAGSFTISAAVGQQWSNIAWWDGANWQVVPGSPSSYDIAAHDDGSGPALYAAVNFFNTSVVRRFDAEAGTWSTIPGTFTAPGTFGSDLLALVSFDDGSGPALYAAGKLTAVGGIPASNIARWRGPAQGWSAVGAGLPGTVSALHVYDPGSGPRLFATASLVPGGMAQWDGQTWSPVGDPLDVAAGTNSPMITFDDGSGPALVLGSGRLARWDGTAWSFLPGFGAHAMVSIGDVLYKGLPFSVVAPGGPALAIDSQTGAGAFNLGVNPALCVTVTGGGAATYQWRRNGAPIGNLSGYTGAHTPCVRIINLNGSHEGVYDCMVTNACTSVTSAPMTLEVIGTCPGDVTIDGRVDVADLLALLGAWGACAPPPTPCAADLNHDAAVNVSDLLALTSHWGACP